MKEHQLKHLRGLGHKLKPVVTVADKGLTDSVRTELEATLDHHELMKVRVRVGDPLHLVQLRVRGDAPPWCLQGNGLSCGFRPDES